MRVRRTDDNQKQLVAQIRKIPGATVSHTHTIGKGFPDIIVGFRGINYLLEVKDPKKTKSQKKLTTDEKVFHDDWTGQVATVETIDDILKILSG